MKITLLAALILCPVFARADFVKVVSPSTAQTFTFSDVTWHSLRWDARTRQLSANLTFSTYKYVTHFEPLQEEGYQFILPGVKFDQATDTFSVRSKHGRQVAVARMTKGLFGQSIQPLPGTVVHIYKASGKVTVTLTASDIPPQYSYHLHWLEQNEGLFLDNAVSAGVASLRQ